ncbi:B12-binding domain-containing radical SAM protein [Nanoarchaeota archaeon]
MDREKVLLVRAPNLYKSEQWKKQGVLRTPTNLALLSSYIREKGAYEPEVLDLELYDFKSIPQVAEKILSKNAKYVGFSTLTPRFPTITRICRDLKKANKDLVTMVGGPHITGRPQDCKYEGIDYGILGEGEEAFLKLLNSLESKQDVTKTPNLAYKENGKVMTNPKTAFIKDLDALPRPAWDLLDLKKYKDPAFFGEEPHAGIFTTRGCPYDCIFCASKVTWERKLRFHSIDNVIEEFGTLSKKGINNLYFYDDQFAVKPQRAIELGKRMISSGLNMKYIVQIRADSVNQELAHTLKESGCLSAAIGVETGNEEMLKVIKKKETKDEIRNAVKILKDEGVPITTSYVLGLPGDTHETLQQTLDFAKELNTEQMKFMLLTPVPGTEAYRMAVEKGLLDPDDLEQMEKTTYYDKTEINLSSVTIPELLHYQDLAYKLLDERLIP